jgi:ParB family transcriptional regulator, chromosome partitioning protein
MPDIQKDNTNKKKGLGRGLGSLLGGASLGAGQAVSPKERPMAAQESPPSALAEKTKATSAQAGAVESSLTIATEGKVWKVAIDKLQPGAFQPRQHFNKIALEGLAQSIRSNGILQPITVRKTQHPNRFEIVAGERRWRAAQLAGLHEVPVLIKSYSDKEALELAIIENIQREDLDPIEEAEAYLRLIEDFQLSQQQVSEKVGKERATVANAVRLITLPGDVKEMISKKEITVGHAKVLLGLDDRSALSSLAKRVAQERMPVRKLEKIIQEIKNEQKFPHLTQKKTTVPDQSVTLQLIKGLGEELQKSLGTKVNIEYLNSKGKISIQFYSDEELTKIVDRLKGPNP